MKKRIKILVSTIVFGSFIVAALACQSSASAYEKAYGKALLKDASTNTQPQTQDIGKGI